MFSGFQNNYLIKKEFEYFNGLRVTMKPPMHPCKVGLHIQVSMGNEHELFVVSSHLLSFKVFFLIGPLARYK